MNQRKAASIIGIVCIILGAALAAAAGWLILLKRDIRQLWRGLREIADIETNARLTTRTFDKDIAALTESVNKSLERSKRDIYAKVRAEATLKRAITNISHDLRTPLTSALGYLQLIESSEGDAETNARYLEIIRGRLETLSVLMSNLFELTRIIEGRVDFNIQKVNVGNIMRDTLAASYAELDSKGFTVEAAIPDAPIMRMCDEDALRRVLQNLVKNASIHGKEYLRVQLDDAKIEIANKADGLAELDSERIFERFYTADASRTSKNTGLGLAIVKELLARTNGSVEAKVDEGMFVVRVRLGD